MMKYVYNDGGRAVEFKGQTGDCVTRAIAIVSGKSYREVYDVLNEMSKNERIGKRQKNRSNSRIGVHRKTYEKYLLANGFRWVAMMKIGVGCTMHLKDDEIPVGHLILSLSRHLVAVIDKVIYDIYDPSRNGTRCVYGYYIKEEKLIDKANDILNN